MPLFSVAARSEPAVIAWRWRNELKAREYETLGEAEDVWMSPSLLLYSCVLFLQRRDGVWIVWRKHGLPSSVTWIKDQFADPTIRARIFARLDGADETASSIPVVADRDPAGARAGAVAAVPVSSPEVVHAAPAPPQDGADDVPVAVLVQ